MSKRKLKILYNCFFAAFTLMSIKIIGDNSFIFRSVEHDLLQPAVFIGIVMVGIKIQIKIINN